MSELSGTGASRGLGHGIATALRRGRRQPPQQQALAGGFQWPSGFCGAIGLAAIPAALLLVRGAVPPSGGRASPTRGTVRQPRRNSRNSLRRMIESTLVPLDGVIGGSKAGAA
jgi:hypothetical protein